MLLPFLLTIPLATISPAQAQTPDPPAFQPNDAIRPNPSNAFYWQYQGEPVLLLGAGMNQDNPFNHPNGLEARLDQQQQAGSNYVRNTMSSRDPGNRFPFHQQRDGRYDLDRWDDAYWTRFERFLQMTYERGIIVQIEIWDPWDYFRSESGLFDNNSIGWGTQPWNPVNNVNYTVATSGLAPHIDYYSSERPSRHAFFHTVPAMDDNETVRAYQEAFVDRLLDATLSYPHVLYTMNNEIGEDPRWGQYWARYIRQRARAEGRTVFLSDMRRNSNFSSDEQQALLRDTTHYDFFEISQNNTNKGQDHYRQIQTIRDQIVDASRPLNNIKIYGGHLNWTGGATEATHRFWRNIFAGLASSRFHRPGPNHSGNNRGDFGIGGSALAVTHLRGLRAVLDRMGGIDAVRSHADPEIRSLLRERATDEAYVMANPGRAYAVYFVNGGAVTLDTATNSEQLTLRWYHIAEETWTPPQPMQNTSVHLNTPGPGPWVAVLTADDGRS